jgi:hypothetical protein
MLSPGTGVACCATRAIFIEDAFLVTGKAITAGAAGRILKAEAKEKVGRASTHAEDGVDVPAS